MKNLARILSVLVILSLVTGCGRSGATATSPPTNTPQPADTSAPTKTPKPTHMPTTAPTRTQKPTATPLPTPIQVISQSDIDAYCAGQNGALRATIRVPSDDINGTSYSDLSDLSNSCYSDMGRTAFISDLMTQGVIPSDNGVPMGTTNDYQLDPSVLEAGFQIYVRPFSEYRGFPSVYVGGIKIELPTQRLVNIFPAPGGMTVANVSYIGEDGNQYAHLDAGPPDGVNRFIIPASGPITYHFLDDHGNDVLVIMPYGPLEGIVEALQISGIDPQEVTAIQYHIGHCVSDITSGNVNAGMEFCTRFDRPGDYDIVCYVIRVITRTGHYQINPCLLPHDGGTPDWCLVCAPNRDCNPDNPLRPVIKDH